MQLRSSAQRLLPALCTLLTTVAIVGSTGAQAQAQGGNVPDVGQVAPDFSSAGVTRYGLLRGPVQLSDFRGKTVVLAFFARARTKG